MMMLEIFIIGFAMVTLVFVMIMIQIKRPSDDKMFQLLVEHRTFEKLHAITEVEIRRQVEQAANNLSGHQPKPPNEGSGVSPPPHPRKA